MLNVEMVAKALDIPIAPPNLVDFQPPTRADAAEMVRIISQGQSSNPHMVSRKEMKSNFWFLDHVLHFNVYPCQHSMQRREDILVALFWIVTG